MGRLDLPDVRRDEDLSSTCTVCMRWNRGASVTFGTTVCGRAYCLFVAKARAEFAGTLTSDHEGLD